MLFGGVFDNEEDDENLESQFYNDQYILDLEKCRFHTLTLNGPKQAKDTQQKGNNANDERLLLVLWCYLPMTQPFLWFVYPNKKVYLMHQ